jgi:hypothetical protein
VDNEFRVYWLTAVFPEEPQGENLRLLAVRVSYTITRPY